MCCYCRDGHASWTVGDSNSTRRWHIYQNNISERHFYRRLLNRGVATAGPDSQFRLDPALVLFNFFSFPLLGGGTPHPHVPSSVRFLLPIISLLPLPPPAFVPTREGFSLPLGAGRRGPPWSWVDPPRPSRQPQAGRAPRAREQSAPSKEPNTKYYFYFIFFLTG